MIFFTTEQPKNCDLLISNPPFSQQNEIIDYLTKKEDDARMATKIGNFYITRNNPRELLKERADLQNVIAELEGWLLNNWQAYIGSKNTYAQGKKFAYYKAYKKLQKLKEYYGLRV